MAETGSHDAVNRTEPPVTAGEREMLEGWLDFHRDTLLIKCQGLTDEQLKTRSAPPSSMSLLGLVRHMTDVERNWFLRVLAEQDAPPIHYTADNPDGEFDEVEEADVAADLARFRDMVDRCRGVAAEYPDLDVVAAGVRGGKPYEFSLRWIYVHMVEEYARHNGHADLLRERIDGATGV